MGQFLRVDRSSKSKGLIVEPQTEHIPSTTDHNRLERCRDRRNAAAHSASVAQATESTTDRELAGNVERLREQKRLLQSLREQTKALKKSVKQLEKRGEKLRGKSQAAKKDNSKAHKKLETAEAKYERSVIAEMVRREKKIDLDEHTSRSTTGQSMTARSLPQGDSPVATAIGTAGRR